MELSSQSSMFSKDAATNGFDLSAGNTWIYPENYPVREYQFNIVKSVLYRNTLVCLPTGLGKTFIAAVVMYNFWRWYPYGKIVFLAPTKPLVAQQIDACYKVMGIPSVDMMELTGAVNQKNRETAWSKKRIIFATPQVFHNDLERSIVPSHLVKCVVVDEAHRALGKHSYCECIRILSIQNQYFRILALSATPGNKLNNVHEVIQNLHISHLELREENSIDIIPYINKRKVDIILVPLSDELATFKEKYIVIMDRHVRFLMQCNILRGHTANISKGRIFYLLKEFKAKTDKSGNYAQIMKTLTILLTMYHAYELMIRHGLRAFCKFYQTHSDKFWMCNENHLRDLLHDIEAYLGPFPDIHLNGDVVSNMPANLIFGHNKFHKLKELLENHFKTNSGNQKDTRAIVFVEYIDIVNEVYILLLQSKPIIRPQMFVGQARQKQKQQMKALEDFRNNHVNVLISTSIGEEGLDVGEVDLIICFDVSQHSPIRLVQRMGRTGRKRDGHIIVLVTDGKEHENLKSTLSRRDSLNNKILNTSNILSSIYENNPRMIPNQFTPECHKIHIVALPKTPNVKGKRKRRIVDKRSEASSAKQRENLLSKMEAGQSSMRKFFTDSKCKGQNRNNTLAKYSRCDILTQLTTQSNTHLRNTINPNSVKLLSEDNAGIDFLTLCAVKNSEEEMSYEIVCKMDMTYMPKPKPVKDLYNFVVPDMKVVDGLSFSMKFTDILQVQSTSFDDGAQVVEADTAQCENSNDKCIDNNNDYVNVNDDNFWCTVVQTGRNVDNEEIRFEDILDESSDSDKTEIVYLNKQIADIEINPIEANECFASNMQGDDNAVATDTRTKLSIDTQDLESSLFENILNESFSSIEDDFKTKDTTNENTPSPHCSKVFAKNAEKTTHDVNIASILHDEDRFAKFNQDLSVPMEFTRWKPNQLDTLADELQDFNSDDDISKFVKHESSEKNTSLHTSKAEESLLSITQAIGEVAQMKRNAAKSPSLFSVSKQISIEGDDAGWISVDIKCETEKQKLGNGSTNSKINLSNIKRNSTAKSCTFKRNLDVLDSSDQDFMITEDNARKLDELESSYFRNNPSETESEDSSSCLQPGSTAKKYTQINGSVDKSKNMKPCGMSTPIRDKRPGLSLKGNRRIHSDVIDFGEASGRCMNNARDENILESNSSPSKQMFSLDRKIARKNRRKRSDIKNRFIDDEAEVDCNFVSSDESIDDDDDHDDENLADFVSYTQYSQYSHDQVDMHAHYLQTIKSPIKRPGVFHFRKPPSTDQNVKDSFSSSLSLAQDSYVYDSFCVEEDIEPSMLIHNDSILERAEKELERNGRKRVCFDKGTKLTKKKKTNVLNQSVSSEDEIEQLRIQVQEN